MTTLWRAFEDAPVLMEVAEVWRQRLGTEFELLGRFFTPTNRIATCISFGRQNEYWRIIEEPDRIVAVNHKTYEHKFVQRSDVILHRIDVQALAKEACEALRWNYQFESLGQTHHICQIGLLPASLNGLPVYFCIRKYSTDVVREIDSIARHAGGPFLLTMPTAAPFDSNAMVWLGRADGYFVPMSELVDVGGAKLAAQTDATAKLQRALRIEVVKSHPYQFKLVGDSHRFVAFNGPAKVVDESPGTFYIAKLIASPGREIWASELQSYRSGINPIVSSGSMGTIIDEEARRNYATRLRDVVTEIADVRDSVSEDRLAELHTERDHLMATLNGATQRGNELREDADSDRARQAVCAAIRRGFKEIAKRDEALANHLRNSINLGFKCGYAPASSVDWEF